LRHELAQRFEVLEAGYQAHRVVGGETALSLRERVNYLRQGIERIDRLGVAGLLELQRGLEESQPLLDRVRDEHQTAKILAQGLQNLDIDSLLGIFSPEETANISGENLGDELAFDADMQAGLLIQARQQGLTDDNRARAESYAELLDIENQLTARQLERWEALQLKASRAQSRAEKLGTRLAENLSLQESLETLKKGLQPGSPRDLPSLESLEAIAMQVESTLDRVVSTSTRESHEAATEILSFYEEGGEVPPELKRIFTRLESSGASGVTVMENWHRVIGGLAIPLGSLGKLFEFCNQMGFGTHKGDLGHVALSYGSRMLIALPFDDNALIFTCDPKLELRLLSEAKTQIPFLVRALS
jgi:hypothetical protein